MNAIINTACQSMNTQGFAGFYHSLVAQVAPNLPMTYGEFVNRTGRATLPLTSQNDGKPPTIPLLRWFPAMW